MNNAAENKVKKVLLVAGGTGGHIFPALAFGRWLSARNRVEHVTYLSGSRPLELEIYRSQGIDPFPLSLRGSPLGSRSAVEIFRRCAGLVRAFFQAAALLRRRRPDICFLFGGYVSLMPLLLCRFLGIPVIVHEQNACAGKVTRLASRMGCRVASGWDECKGISGSFTYVGIPVRPLLKVPRPEALAALGLDLNFEDADDALVVGVVGGSLSSASLTALIGKLSGRSAAKTDGRIVFVVLGDGTDMRNAREVRFVGRRWNMAPFYSLCDAVICRAGASTLAELAAYGIPALAIPWGGASDGHQEMNARRFAALTGNPLWVEDEKTKHEQDGLEDAFAKLSARCASVRTEGDAVPFFEDTASEALWQLGLES